VETSALDQSVCKSGTLAAAIGAREQPGFYAGAQSRALQGVVGDATTSESGPSQHFAPPHDFGRKLGIAEVDGQLSIVEGDARDPNRTFTT
jgi:hypothetical protein